MAEGHVESRLGEKQSNQEGGRQSPPLTLILNFQKALRIEKPPSQSQAHRAVSEDLYGVVVGVSKGTGAESCATSGTSGALTWTRPSPPCDPMSPRVKGETRGPELRFPFSSGSDLLGGGPHKEAPQEVILWGQSPLQQ